MSNALLEPETKKEVVEISLDEPPSTKESAQERWGRWRFILIFFGGGIVAYGLATLVTLYFHYHPLELFN